MGAGDDENISEAYKMLEQELSDANQNLTKVVDESFGDLIGGLDDSGGSFADNTGKIMSDIKDALPTDEFAGVDEQISRQALENRGPDEKYADNSVDKIMEDIKKTLPTNGVDLEKMGGDMLANMPKDEKYSQPNEDPTKRINADMQSDQIRKAKAIKFSDISVDASGMPIVKSKADQLKKPEPKKEDTSSNDAEADKLKRQADAKKSEDEEKKKGEVSRDQKANLDDVVKKLEMLNSTVNVLIKKTEEASANQVKATKNIASGNLFGAR